MPKPLVIVESPAKAKTIAGFLGNGYMVESSVGHIRDLPSDARDIPAAFKGEPWSRLGVDVDNGFKPLYVVVQGKKERVTKLKALLKDASELYLATDEDREGESIAWHLLEVLNPRVPVKRMVFHEITREAIRRAVDNWRDLDRRLVDAQETRRILDRLYGYEVSPVLWRKVLPRLSAGRVQSVATRLLVERERARHALPGRLLLGRLGALPGRRRGVRRHARRPRRCPPGDGTGLRRRRPAQPGRCRPAGRDRRPGTGGPAVGGQVRRTQCRRETLATFSLRPVPHLHAPAGGGPEAALLRRPHDAGGPGSLRGRPHHLHAHRQHGAVRPGPVGRPQRRARPVRRRLPAGRPPPVREAGQERSGGARGHPPRR